MCWKISSPPPEPSPAATLLSTLSTVTEPAQFNVTEVSGSMCPRTATQCNSTGITCYNDGIVCCDRHSTELYCSCQAGFSPPDCLFHDIEAAIDHFPVQRPPEVLTTGLRLSTMLGYTDPAEVSKALAMVDGLSTYGENFGGRIGVIAFIVAITLLTIAVAVVLVLRRRRTRRQQQNSSTTEQGTELPERHVDRKTSDSCSASLLNSHFSSKTEG